MNTLVAVAIAPFGVGDELAPEVAEVVRVIRESGLPNRTYSMFTEIEGEWDEVMRVVRDATFVLAEKGIRTEVVLKADVRPGHDHMMDKKAARVDAILAGSGPAGDAASNAAPAASAVSNADSGLTKAADSVTAPYVDGASAADSATTPDTAASANQKAGE